MTSTFQVAPEAGWARRKGPREFLRLNAAIGVIVLYSVWGVGVAVAVATGPIVDGVFGEGCCGDGDDVDARVGAISHKRLLLSVRS